MFKTYQRYIIKNFLSKYFTITFIFFSLTIVLGSFEEISFFKNLDVNFLYPYFLTLLNAPITLFEIFPFILLLSTQFLFYDIFKKDELNLLKSNGLKNTSIIKIIFFLSIVIGLFNITIFYNLSSTLKFYYSDIKNSFSDDNKYLAMVTKSGLWIKDEVGGKKVIIKSQYIEKDILNEVFINEFDENFNLIRTIQSKKIDITNFKWIIYDPIVTIDNISTFFKEKIILETHFNYEKITKLFSNVSTLSVFKLFYLKNDYESLGYSSDEITIQLLKLAITPILYGILVLMASILMFNMNRNSSIIFFISLGFLISVAIYYLMFFFTSLGNNGKVPLQLSISFPISILLIITILGIININEK